MTPPKSQQRMQCEEITSNFTPSHPCAQWFSSIERSVLELSRQVENVALDVKELTEKVISQETMMRMWKEEFLPQIRNFPSLINEELEDHKKKCLASLRAQRRAEDTSDSPAKEGMERREDRKGFTIPKIVIYIGVVIGTAIAIGGYVLAYLLEKLPQ